MQRFQSVNAKVDVISGELTVIRVTGEIDLSNVEYLRSAMDMAVGGCSIGLVIDLGPADFIDSSAIEAIMRARQRLAEIDCDMALVTSDLNLKRLLGLIRLDTIPGLCLCDDLDSATRILSDKRG
jgi:anti-anti-sigma factor